MKNLKHFYNTKVTKKLLFSTIISLLLLYFIFHTVYGNRGLISYFKLNQKISKANDELMILRHERIENEHKVRLLKSGDKDIIDEKARNILGVASPNEQVFTNQVKSNIKN